MSKSGQAHAAMMHGSQSTLYAVMRSLGIPLSKEQEEFQARLERMHPPVIDDTPDPTRKFVCCHLRTTLIADKKYCVDCGEEILEGKTL